MRGKLAIAIAGAVGLAVLARTAAYYQRTDGPALALVALMAAAFVGGLVEVALRAWRAEQAERELAALPTPATDAAIDAASPPLRALLRARIARTPAPPPASVAPYLVGLLVMLGLLGTFLGLFETLRGAREALATSSDVDALRAGLSLPMQGLTRSFGTSAAGISTSAMLGLAASFARAAEAHLAQRLAAYAPAALAPLTIEHRQLAALERIARQSEALSEATAAMRQAASGLTALEATWTRAQGDATERTAQALLAAVEAVRGELGEAATAMRGELAASVKGLRSEIAASVKDARGDLTASTASLREEIAASVKGLRGDLAASAEAVRGDLTASAEAVRGGLEAGAASVRADLTAGVASVRADLTAGVASVRADLEASMAKSVQAASDVVAPLAARAAEAAAKTIDAAAKRMETVGDRDAARAAAVDRLLAAATAQADAMTGAAQAQATSLDAILTAVSAREAEADARLREERAGLLAIVEEARAASAERAAALEDAIAQAHAAHAADLAGRIGAHVEATQASLAKSAEAVQEAAALVQAGGAEMSAVAEAFAGVVDRQRDAATAWMQSLGAVEAAVEQAGEASAARGFGEQLDRARELFDVQLQFHRELLLQLRSGERTNGAHVLPADEPEPARSSDDVSA